MNIEKYQYDPSTSIEDLKAMRSEVDRRIQRAVKTGTGIAFRKIFDLPISINGPESTSDVQAILSDVRNQEGVSDFYRSAYLNGLQGAMSVQDYLENVATEEQIFKITNSFDWIKSRLLQGLPGHRLRVHPSPNRKHGKLVETLFQAQHNIKLDTASLQGLVWNCFPAFKPRTRKTGPYRTQTDSFKKPRRRNARQWLTTNYEPELLKAKLLRNELSAAMDTTFLLETISDKDFFLELTQGEIYTYTEHLLSYLFWDNTDSVEMTVLLDQLCDDGELVEKYRQDGFTRAIDNSEERGTVNSCLRGLVEGMISNANTNHFNGAQTRAVINALTEALKPYNTAK